MKIQNVSGVSFRMAPGNYINPRAAEQKTILKSALIDSCEHNNNIAGAVTTAIRKIFPAMNFILTGIETIKSPIMQKISPIIRVITTYDKEELLTFMFLNGQKMIDILEDDEDEDIYGGAKANKMFDDIAENVVLANEPYFISDVVSDFTERIYLQDDVTPETVNNAARESLVKYDIDIDNEVLSEQDFCSKNGKIENKNSNMVGITYSPKNIKTTMYVNGKTSENVRYSAIPQNFANVLCANSKMFNGLEMEVRNYSESPEVMIDWGSLFAQLANFDNNFLELPPEIKQKTYMPIVQIVLNSFAPEHREAVFKQMLTQTAQEALAYTIAPNILDLDDSKKYIPIGAYFRDFNRYLNVVNFTDYMI